MKPNQAMRIYALLLFAGACTIFLAFCLNDSLTNPFVWIGLGTYLVAFWIRYHYVRCPYCGSRMKYIRQLPQCCPDCGKELEETP